MCYHKLRVMLKSRLETELPNWSVTLSETLDLPVLQSVVS